MEEKNDDGEEDDEIIKIILHPDSEIITSDGTVKKVSDVEENDVLLGSSHCNVVFKKYLSEIWGKNYEIDSAPIINKADSLQLKLRGFTGELTLYEMK